MAISVNTALLSQSMELAETAAKIANEAQPYSQDGEMFKSLAELAKEFSSAALRTLQVAIIDTPAEIEAPAPTDGA